MDSAQIEIRRQHPQSDSTFKALQSTICSMPAQVLYQSTRRSLLAQALRITRSSHAAEEIVQDVFTYAWQNSENYDPHLSAFRTWLSMLCRSRSIDYLRSEKPHENSPDSTCELDLAPDHSPGPEALHASSALKSSITAALLLLPARYRQVLSLHYFSELSHLEISALVGMPVGTVKTNIRRGKTLLAADQCLSSFHCHR
ncbi:sigma-70 family RNA polymerase sigma factor [Pseudoduganella sp. FT25W]|jgi:RNA polymerase sigma-70 factor (ECF subfamily)|uniref:Sigma-70 family RNA polymerase sigma factor n=1 Tax=Duganella alba TaxID=2666081 RepID=A0A6L5QBK7_9BURK|nr:sigma-70 family RNA polymerase sigma factor [Duganella alba]MRX07154.1 sigma-70 family RNA polymerase sigma factor [Duganella alba]MRX15151.1 sigma-70 family RNA polymerase sigma factor [Duganella alba]